ncbi:MAG TPA: HAD-IC family P-type ATPase [Candidatus Binatia bacterium]|nr:HAD-IC family P-type ATPase [Candidatus Binatia bacterium]
MSLAPAPSSPLPEAAPYEREIAHLRGLNDATAAARLAADGPNELPSAERRRLSTIAADVVREPMIALLIACGAVYLVLGDVQEAAALVVSIGVVVGITLQQQRKAERALDALRDLSSPRALVIRDGGERRIAGRDVVRGDLVVLAEGDRVPADAVVLWSVSLVVDESLLTGESVPVRKSSGSEGAAPARPGGDDSPFVYSGTLVVGGQAIARVTATGLASELGRIGKSLGGVGGGHTRLEGEVHRFVRVLATVGLALCAVVAVGWGVARQDWLEGALAGLALAMSVLPEEFPVILTLFLAIGAWRISRRNVLVRQMPALEALGAATVLCVDKTGTLTENRMTPTALSVANERYDVAAHAGDPLPESFHRLLEFAVLASQQSPFDPMERTIKELAAVRLAGTEHLHETWVLEREYPLSRVLLAMSHVWRAPEGGSWIVAAKGAPEAIVDLCHLGVAEASVVATETTALAERGLRVLGVAAARFQAPSLPPEQHDFVFEFLGLIGFSDPVRATVPAAVAECYRAGIRTVMITGDYPATARTIAAEVGLTPRDDVLTGAELDRMDDAQLATRVPAVNVFARVVPEQKLRLVRALAARGEVVAMTGDGVNDAPALEAADIGIAMGARGTDVAREAADLVLLDDDFSSIAQAIRLGRRVYDNIRKGTAYVLAIHVPIAGLALLPVAMGWPLVLLPIHIVLLELIIDPACSIAFEAEPEEADVMDRPPRSPASRLFERRAIALALVQGLVAFVLVALALAVAVGSGYDAERARTLAFSSLIAANLALILANRSMSRSAASMLRVPNPALWWIVGGAVTVLALGLAVAPLRDFFRFGAPSRHDVATVLAIGGVSLVGFDLLKRRSIARIATYCGLLALPLLVVARDGEAAPPAGEVLYRRYCASCHGVAGRGDGPAATALCPPPSDLTRLESSVSDLMRQIDGRRTIRAHGTAPMPVWGEVFEESLLGEPHRRRTALHTLQTLAEYVRSLRATSPKDEPARSR